MELNLIEGELYDQGRMLEVASLQDAAILTREPEEETVAEVLEELEHMEYLAVSLDSRDEEKIRKIDRHVPGNPGRLLVVEAKRARLWVRRACGLVTQEAAFRNIFGCDHGSVGDRPPYCHQAVTNGRVDRLVRSPFMNGIGHTQLTWWEFVLRAQRMGGAHRIENQYRVGFALLAVYIRKYGVLDGFGAYNAGEANRRSVRNTYSRSAMNYTNQWERILS